MKTCTRCNNELALDKFQERAPGYLYRQCRKCRLEVRHERYKDYPQSKINDQERAKKWYEDNRERVLGERKNKRDKFGNKWYTLKYCYKLNKEQYHLILNNQKNACAICKENKKLYVDHDHSCCPTENTCGKCIRGLICQKCNMMMHYIDECSDLFEAAFKYATGRVIVKEIYDK